MDPDYRGGAMVDAQVNLYVAAAAQVAIASLVVYAWRGLNRIERRLGALEVRLKALEHDMRAVENAVHDLYRVIISAPRGETP